MIKCPDCGTLNSAESEICEGCGRDWPPAGAGVESDTGPGTGATPSVEPPLPPMDRPPTLGGAASLTLKRSGALTAETFPLGERSTIGRFDRETGPIDVDLTPLPESTYITRRHAEIWRDDAGQWLVKDLGSRNGTFVRRAGGGQFEPVTGEQAIADGDEIALGNARFEFRAG
jgi:hypothetical protein